MAMSSFRGENGWRIPSVSRLAVEGYVEQQSENHNWNQGHQRVEENLLPRSTQLIRATPVHSHAFDAANADQLDANVVASVLLFGAGDKLAGSGI